MRNIRNISVKGYKVNYAVVTNGKLVQHETDSDTASPRRLIANIAAAHGVTADKVVIISTSEYTNTYRINDILKAVHVLVENGLADEVTGAPSESE